MICFDCAGGNALPFLPWQERVDPTLEICAVQLPGRGARMAEPPPGSMRELVRALAAVVAPLTDQPFAFLGHSLGALIAFELARLCRLQYIPTPQHLFVAGCGGPRQRERLGLHLLPDEQLSDALRTYNGTPPELLEHHALMAAVLPAIRADFCMVDDYEYRASLPLTAPITVLAGRADPHVSADQAEGWRAETTSDCRVAWFDGDHFFLHPSRDAVIRCIDQRWPAA